LGGLELEIKRVYYSDKLLDKVVREIHTLIEASKHAPEGSQSDMDSDRAVPRLTAGGIIALNRTLTRLQKLLDSAPS
jgi:ubiquitin-conjugating enzyme E2 O